MSGNTKTIKCARCKVAVEISTNANSQSVVRCPSCGLTDTLKNVEREIADLAEEYVGEQLDATFKRIASRSKFLTYKPGTRHKRSHRFIIDFK